MDPGHPTPAPALKSPYSAHPWRSDVARLAAALVVATSTFLIAFDGGGYALTTRHTAAVLLLWLLVVGVGVGFWPRSRVPVAALAVGALLLAFAIWVGLSALWSPSIEKTVTELDRVVLYIAIFAVAVISTASVSGLYAWLRGLGTGIAAVGLLALASRFFPEQFEATSAIRLAELYPSAGRRLNYPLEYWNGLATLIALGIPCLLWAATAERRALLRGLAVLPIPALATALYLTSSRGGIAVATLGVIVFIALARRWRALGAVAIATVIAIPTVLAVAGREALIAGPLTPGAIAEGREAAAAVGAACLLAAVLHGFASSIRLDLGRSGSALGWAAATVVALALIVGAVAADPIDRLERFKSVPSAPTAESQSVRGHLADMSGNGRWQLWESAWAQFREHPIVGEGAGTYEAWWAENGTLDLFVRDAHSLYLEVLGEVGVVGFVLLVAALVAGLVVGISRALTADQQRRPAIAALVAVIVAWSIEAGADWMWESTVVTLVAAACLGLLVGAATHEQEGTSWRPRGRGWLGARIGIVAVALVLIAVQTVPLISQLQIERSQTAVRAEDAEAALEAAESARRIQPWAASPHVQVALVEELRGDLRTARTAIRRALARDERDWRLWLIDARLETKLENFDAAAESLRQAIALNPRSSRFEGLPGASG